MNGLTPQELRRQKRTGIAFQDHALLPWRSVAANVGLPFEVTGVTVDEPDAAELLELIGLSQFAKSRPWQLSGRMRQRTPEFHDYVDHATRLLFE